MIVVSELKKIGKILHRSPLTQNILIARLNEPVRIGTMIYDATMREIGPIIELFGPVDKPYARIKIKDNVEASSILGKDCYMIVGDEVPVRWKKMPKKYRKR